MTEAGSGPGAAAPPPPQSPSPSPPRRPVDLARATLARYAAAARSAPRRRSRSTSDRGDRGDRPQVQLSGAHPDARDPQLLGPGIEALLEDRDWRQAATIGTVLGCWDKVAGPEVAAHCRPERLRDGELLLVAESTAWATQLRLLASTILARLAAEVGPDVVRRVQVRGPTAPDWRHGRLRVTGGRGPRDTYG